MQGLKLLPRNFQEGQTLIEVLVAIALTAILLPALATGLVASSAAKAQEEQRIQASALLREADEAVRSVREKGWSQIPANGTYKPQISGSTWSLAAGSEVINGLTRQVVVSNTLRNSAGAIVTSGGTVDPSTKTVVSTISWATPIAASVSTTTYLQRYMGNTTLTQTTQAEFDAGIKTNVASTNTSGGEVQLATTPGTINWGSPSIVGSYNATGTTDATDVFSVGNYIYIANGTLLTILTIASPGTPTVPTLVGTYTASAAINQVYVSGNYAYLATGSDTAEVIVVNITNPAAPVLAGNENLAGTADALGIYVDGTFAYVGRVTSVTTNSFEFQILNVTTPANPAPLGGINFTTGNLTNVIANGNSVYASSTIDAQELLVLDVTNKNTPTTAGSYNAVGTADGVDLSTNGTTVYLALLNNTSGAELFSINAAVPATPTLLGSYEVGGAVTGVSYLNNFAFLTTAIVNRQLIIVDAATPASLSLEANLNLANNANDVKAVGNYAYIANASNTQELLIAGPAIGPSGFQASGTFESSSITLGPSLGFNYLTFSITEPASTNIQFQVAANNDNTTWNYVGPDGTAGTFFTAAGGIPMQAAAGQYFRYRASFTGPGTSTPTLSDVTINYSP